VRPSAHTQQSGKRSSTAAAKGKLDYYFFLSKQRTNHLPKPRNSLTMASGAKGGAKAMGSRISLNETGSQENLTEIMASSAECFWGR